MKKEIKNPETSVEYTNKYGSKKQTKKIKKKKQKKKKKKKNGVETIVDNDGILWLNQI